MEFRIGHSFIDEKEQLRIILSCFFSIKEILKPFLRYSFVRNPSNFITKTTTMKKLYFLLCLGLCVSSFAQSNVKADAPNIFIDCQTWCQMTFLKQELSYVNHMLDRQNADVFIQITSLETGSGGDQYIIEYKGQGRFEGQEGKVSYNLEPNISDNEQRNSMLKNIEKALLPFLLKTSVAEEVSFSINKETNNETNTESLHDPWNAWVFNLRANMNLNGQQVVRYTNLNSSLSANRVTEKSKILFRFFHMFNRQRFTFLDDDGNEEVETYDITGKGGRLTYVKSITDRFSAGFFASGEENSFENYNLSASVQPAIEYNLYPYQEANKRQLSALYRIGPQYNNYIDTTIFDLKEELLYRHSLELQFTKVEDWGSFDVTITSGNYLHDWSLLFASINPWIELNVVKGLRLNVGGNFRWIRNQINIPKDDVSREELLLQLQQLQSNYSYYGWAGINYRFGSTYNNVVNVRF